MGELVFKSFDVVGRKFLRDFVVHVVSEFIVDFFWNYAFGEREENSFDLIFKVD